MASRPATQEEITTLMSHLFGVVEVFGLGLVQEKILEIYVSEENKLRVLRKKILEEISSTYRVPISQILHSKKRGCITDAKVMAIILIHYHLKMSNAEIATLFGCGKRIVERKISAFKKTSSPSSEFSDSDNAIVKIYSDKSFLDNFNVINEKINSYKGLWKSK